MIYLILAGRWLLALVFLVAGLAKDRDRDALAEAVERYRVVPQRLVGPLAAALPPVELALAFALALGIWPEVAGGVTTVVMVAFGCAVAWNLLHGRQFDCGCGLSNETPISWRIVMRNTLLAFVALGVAIGPSTALSVLPGPLDVASSVPAASRLIAVPMLVVLLAACARLEAQRRFLRARVEPSTRFDADASSTDHGSALRIVRVGHTGPRSGGAR
jgi:uncharacterized membrane protein YphA (DoxX/SURF4 family)